MNQNSSQRPFAEYLFCRVVLFSALFLFWSCKSNSIVQTPRDIQQGMVNIPLILETSAGDSEIQKQIKISKEYQIAAYRASQQRDFDILHTSLDLAFDYQNQTVLGKANLLIKPFKYPQKILRIDAQDFEVDKIYFSAGINEQELVYQYDGQQFSISLPEELTAKDTFGIFFNYVAYPNRNSGTGSEAIMDTKGLYFIDPLDTIPNKPTMIWTQGETMHNSKWFPTIDHPNERFTQRLNLKVIDSLVSISNGELVSQQDLGNGFRVDSWEMKLPHAPYLVALVIGDFGKVSDNWEALSLGYFVEKGFEKGAAKVFENTPEMIGFFSNLTGVDFPWPKYDQIVVRDFVSGAMENTTASIFMEELLLTEREAIDSEWDYIIAHELFHQWFGDYVTAESWSNLTLNEAFANYSEFLWNEYKLGEDHAKLKLIAETENYFAEAEGKNVDLIRFQYANDEDMFDSHTYSKGGVILHMLREHLGKEVFYEGLTVYLKANALKSVEVHDLRLAMEQVSGQDLNWFFNQWFLDKGHPELNVEVDYSNPGNILISVTQTQDLANYPLYQLPFEISWYADEKRFKKGFLLDKVFAQFALENGNAVSQVFFDEQKNLLAKVSFEKSADEYQQQFENSEIGISRYEALDSLVSREAIDNLEAIIERVISDEFWAIRESGLRIVQGNKTWLEDNVDLAYKVLLIAETDPKNSVRAGAIDALAAYNAEKYQSLFKRLTTDDSYIIAGSALMGLMADGIELEEEFVERFAEETNFRIVIPVSDYYITKPVVGKGKWFHRKLNSQSGEGLYFFLGYYSEYFSRFPEDGKSEAVVNLLRIAERDSKSFMRLGAFQALLAFADDQAVIKELERVTALELDEELKMYYEYFIDALK